MNNSYYGQGAQDQWSHYQNNSKYRTDTQQRQKQERDRQRAAYDARTASQSQATDADMASHSSAHMNPDGYGRPGLSSTINRTADGRFVKENIKSHDAHRCGVSENTSDPREAARPRSSASDKSSMFGGFYFSRSGTTNSTHKHSSSAGDEPQRRRSSIKDKVQDVWRRMSNSYTEATDNLSKAVDPYVNIAQLNAKERQRWEAELRQNAADEEEEKRRSQQSYQASYASSPISSHLSRYSAESYSTSSETYAPKPKKSKDLLTTEMEVCSRCGGAVTGFLTKGRCQECHAKWLQEFWDASDSPAVSQGHEPEETNSNYSNRSSSSSERILRDVNEEDYMKLAASNHIRRVRQTMYNDPGNPFTIDDYSPTGNVPIELGGALYDPDAIPMILKRLSDAVAESEADSQMSLGPNPFEEQAAHHKSIIEPDLIRITPPSADITTIKLDTAVYDPSALASNLRPSSPAPDSPISLGPNPFEERPSLDSPPILIRESALIDAPPPQRPGTPALIEERSIRNPTPPPKDLMFRMILSGSVKRAVHQATHKRSETVPSESKKIGTQGRAYGNRDTRFYGFYDDVLDGYRGSMMF